MGFFNDIFSKKKRTTENKKTLSKELHEIHSLDSFLNSFLTGSHYVSKKEYSSDIKEKAKIVSWFEVLDSSNTLEAYCENYGESAKKIKDIIERYRNFPRLVDAQNKRYVSRKLEEEAEYLDHILDDSDPNIMLDEDQRKVVLCDEDYSLVIAGAGAGKTTTIASKVKYLVDKQDIKPEEILIISFTNKAVNELKQRINKDLNLPCPIATFHSTGNAILNINDPKQLNIVENNKLYYCIRDYFKGNVLKNPNVVKNLVLFFASYFDAPYEGDDINNFFNHIAAGNYATMRSELDEFREEVMDRRNKQKITIQNEIVRSMQEVEIANFLYLNSIDYVYEPIYKYNISLSRKPYTPDFLITQGDKTTYIEHFGVTENGENFLYSQEDLDVYKDAVNDKVLLHKKHGTDLIYTFSSFNDGRSISSHLEEKLLERGYELKRRSDEEVIKKLISNEENRYINRLIFLVINFIKNYKVNGYDEEHFDVLERGTENVRTKLFLNICHACYLEYERYLVENQAVDFEDMINESAKVLNEVKEMKRKLSFKYLIVDEYQDISRQRFDLVKAFSEVTDAKILAVGDDWQSIYAFSGSDITLFTKFEEKMGYAKLLKIERTYRNSQEVIDIAGNFIQKNTTQIPKTLISNKHISDPVIIYTYNSKRKEQKEDRRSGVNYATAFAVQTAIEQIVEFNKQEGKDSKKSKILLLGRFNFDGDRLTWTGLFEYINRGSKMKSVKYPELDITFMTAHSSKGLGYDNVIVINGRNETYGFPAKIQEDPVLSLVVKEDRSIQYAEERRLFYVAMTRTKNRVYFVAPESNPSEFLLEIKNEYKNVRKVGDWSEEPIESPQKKCPICGFPLQLKYKKAYGLRLYICTNEPELCSFMTSNIHGKKLSILKCPDCQDGYLVVKSSKNGGECFLGCTNYERNGKGCNKTISAHEYYKMMGYDQSELDKPVYSTPVKSDDINTSDDKEVAKVRAEKTEQRDKRPDVNQNWEEEELKKNENVDVTIDKFPVFKHHSMFEILENIILAQIHISEKRYFGVYVLAGVLRGSKSQKVQKYNLDLINEYNTLLYLERKELVYIIYWLIEHHYFIKTKGKYSVLHITNEGLNYKTNITPRKVKGLFDKLERGDLDIVLSEEDIVQE